MMAYNTSSPKDLTQHKKYHDLHLNGKKWLTSWGDIVVRIGSSSYDELKSSLETSTNVAGPINSLLHHRDKARHSSDDGDYIVMISPKRYNEVRATLDLMRIVNDELNAPHDENDFWSEINETDKLQGRAFVYVKENRAVGVITVEYLENTKRGKWMILETRELVPKVIPEVKLGISRIWVCRNQRHNKIATKLLECARKKSIYGNTVNKWEIAWSQPSESGGKLANSYNAVKHGSGKLLIPCYI